MKNENPSQNSTLHNKEEEKIHPSRESEDVATQESLELNDFEPLGHFTLSKEGGIVKSNLIGARMLGKESSSLIDSRFGLFVTDDSKPIFNLFLGKVFEGRKSESCEVTLSIEGNKLPSYVYISGWVTENGENCQIILVDISERKQTEIELIESEEKYRTLVQYSNDLIFCFNPDETYRFVNDFFAKTFGMLPNDIIGKTPYDIFPTEEAERRLKVVRQVFKSGQSGELEAKVVTPSGGELYYLTSADPVKDEQGKICWVSCISKNITERKHSEMILAESEKNFRSIFENNSAAMAIVEPDTTITMVNEEYCKMSGYIPQEIIGTSWTQQLVPEDLERLKEFNRMRMINPENVPDKYEFKFNTKNGQILNALMSVTVLSNKKIIASFIDITGRKQAEEKLQKSEKFLKEAQIIANLGTFSLDIPSGKWASSEILDKILGIDSDFEKTVKTWELFIHPDWQKVVSDHLIQVFGSNKTSFKQEYKIVRQNDKAERWLLGIGNLKFNDDNLPIAVVGTIQDITERKEAEIELIKAKERAEESDRLKSAFLINMSHEIRTPMSGILGFTELLKEPNLSSDDMQDFIQTIQVSGARMLNTINSIVNIAKIESGLVTLDIQESNINEKIEFAYKFFKPEVESKGLSFLYKNELLSEEANIKTDSEKVYGILTNLVKNAIKFTSEGSIEFGYVLNPGSEPDSTGQSRRAELEFFVKDTGVGIPENQKELIFKRFRQGSESLNRGYQGSGLGLSICKSYVEMLGGKIWVESEEGKGSIFYFTIPYNSVKEEKDKIGNVVPVENNDGQIKKLKILIVEDDEISYSLLNRTLRKISSEVLYEISGAQAIEACRSNSDIDLVLMDIRMPIMDGNEATRQIRRFNKDVIIIAQTAYALPGDCEKAIEAGCNDYITKPINVPLLFKLIKKHSKLNR